MNNETAAAIRYDRKARLRYFIVINVKEETSWIMLN